MQMPGFTAEAVIAPPAERLVRAQAAEPIGIHATRATIAPQSVISSLRCLYACLRGGSNGILCAAACGLEL